MIGKEALKKELERSCSMAIQTEIDRIFDGKAERQKSCTEVENEARELAVKKIRWAAQFNARRRHKFSDDGREFFVSGVQIWKTDVKVLYKPVHEETFDRVGGKRGVITDRSSKSRKKLSFTVANTATPIIGMIVLTWRNAPVDGKSVKKNLTDFFDALRRQWGKQIEWLWWLEFQDRGSPHIHIITSGSIHDELDGRWQERSKRGVKTTRWIYTGQHVDWMAEKWMRIIGMEEDEASRKFNLGGIWERFETPDGAARYCAKDAWKPYQTKVPKEYSDVGAWWHRSRGFETPVMISELLAGEDIVRAGLKMSDGEKLFPVLFNKTKELK